MELPYDAVLCIHRRTLHGTDRWTGYRIPNDGDRRADQRDRVCASDSVFIDDGILCLRYDYDCRGVQRPYCGSIG